MIASVPSTSAFPLRLRKVSEERTGGSGLLENRRFDQKFVIPAVILEWGASSNKELSVVSLLYGYLLSSPSTVDARPNLHSNFVSSWIRKSLFNKSEDV